MSSRWTEITASLNAAIQSGSLRPGDRLPSETELAEQWQVCRMTAHRAMDELQRAGIVVRKRRAGTFVAPSAAVCVPEPARLGAIALLFFHAGDLPQAHYIQGIRSGLPDERPLLFCDTGNDPEREAQHLARMGTDISGVIAYPTCASANLPLYQELVRQGVPVVCVDRAPAGWEADAIVTDNYGSSLAAFRSLTARGHRRIVFLGYEEEKTTVSSVRERREAYLQALQEAGEDAERWVRLLPRALGHDLPQMTDVICSLLLPLTRRQNAPTALFCKDDFVLAAVLEACDQLCLAIPDDMEILSFSDYPPLTLRHTRAVHRLVQQSQAMGQMAAQCLLTRAVDPTTPCQIRRVPALFHQAACVPPLKPEPG